MNTNVILSLTLVIFTLVPVDGWAEDGKPQPDQLCQMLFDNYITGRGKTDTETLMAASHIVAERGRYTGFWRNVLNELKQGKEDTEVGCVHVLGKMLAEDAADRDRIERQKGMVDLPQRGGSICLGPEVVEELQSRGRKADRSRAEHYALALARARVPEASEFFRMILRDDNGKNYMAGAKFHAAVGLAQLGEPDGYEWLIKSVDLTWAVSNARPMGAAYGNLGVCCNAALKKLSGKEESMTKQEWEAWWKETDKNAVKEGCVGMVER